MVVGRTDGETMWEGYMSVDYNEKHTHTAAYFSGYSGSDMDGLIREAALGPIREIKDIRKIDAADVRGVELRDFEVCMCNFVCYEHIFWF